MRVLVTGLVIGAMAWAHHATSAEFDVDKLIVLRGTIKKVEWINPHARLHLDVKDARGKVTTWRIEGASPSVVLKRKGLKEAVTEGLQISITGYPARSGEAMADGATITFKNGKRIFFGGSAPVDNLDKSGKPCIVGKSKECHYAAPLF